MGDDRWANSSKHKARMEWVQRRGWSNSYLIELREFVIKNSPSLRTENKKEKPFN
jgi:hypothetical protein